MSEQPAPSSWGWAVLALLFLDEVLAVVAVAVGGHRLAGAAGAVGGSLLVAALWWTFASPKAARRGAVATPVVKVLVFATATAALWWTGHLGWALTFLVFSAVVHTLARLPFVTALHRGSGAG